MKPPKLLDQVIVAAMLLAYVPGVADHALPVQDPIALIAPVDQDAGDTTNEENPACGH